MPSAVDFAATLISPQAIRDAGHDAVFAYISPSRPGSNFAAKPIPRWYADECRRVGLDIVSIWQYGKHGNTTTPSDHTTGYDGGRRMAREALNNHFAAGGPGYCPIYFAVDFDITLDEWNNVAVHWFRGLCDEIGREWVGIYGHARVLDWAREDGVASWFWQTRAWSKGVILDYLDAYQRVVDTPSTPGPKIDGTSVDVNDIWDGNDYGGWATDRSPKKQEDRPVAAAPQFTEINVIGGSSSNRWGARITNWLIHTQEGNGTAESLAGYLNNSANGVSYHYTVRDGIVCDVVDTDKASWSVLDANSRTINACFAGSFAGWSREQWLAREHDIKIMAWLAVQDARKYGFSTIVIEPDYWVADGISDHKYVTKALRIGNHTDVGWQFPWDIFKYWVGVYAGSVQEAPVVNMIDAEAERAKSWIGERKTNGEITTPDSIGRLAEFENAVVYWTPGTGAHAIPKFLFETYAERGWETGIVGYPTGDHTVLPEGEVQGFERGAIYRKYGQPGFVVRGEIRARWNRSGFENGPFGWPVADEEEFDGGARQRFEHGTIYWPGKRSTVALLDADGADTAVPDTN